MEHKNALMVVCRMVGSKMNITFISPKLEKHPSIPFRIAEIAKASLIRYRQVGLENDWWQQDCGPILGFRQDGLPIALLPLSPSAYTLYDPEKDSYTKVTASMLLEIRKYGYIFYPVLPEKEVDLKDLYNFCRQMDIKKDIIGTVIYSLLYGVLSLAFPVMMGMFLTINNSALKIKMDVWENLWPSMLLIVFSSCAALLFARGVYRSIGRVGNKLSVWLQAAVWDRLLRLPVAFFRGRTPGSISENTVGIQLIKEELCKVLPGTVSSLSACFFLLMLIGWYQLHIFIALSLLSSLYCTVDWYLADRGNKAHEQMLLHQHEIDDVTEPVIAAIAKLRTTGAEGKGFGLWKRAYKPYLYAQGKKYLYSNTTVALWASFPLMSLSIVFTLLSFKSTMNSELIIIVTAYILFLMNLKNLYAAPEAIIRIRSIYHNLKPILTTLPEDRSAKVGPGQLVGNIEFSNVSFRYDLNSDYILRNISFMIEKGEYVAIVGASGSGKSTLLRLMTGLEEPEAGDISYDGYSLKDVDLRAIREQSGIVLQNSRITSGIFLSNICGARPRLTIEDAWAAAKLVGIDGYIKGLPMQMHSLISEAAGTLSEGQKQQILIARALVGKPKVLILDEATGALDNKGQSTIMRNLENMNITRIIIAHRLSTIQNCQRILVLDKGEIVEQGSFRELMKKKGYFAWFFREQMLERSGA